MFFGVAGFGPPNGRQEAAKRPQEGPKWGQDGRQEGAKRAFERKTSKTSKMTTLSMKMLDFEGRGGSKIWKFWSRKGFESRKSSNRCKKVVAKGLRDAFQTENGAIPTRGTGGLGSWKGGRGDG